MELLQEPVRLGSHQALARSAAPSSPVTDEVPQDPIRLPVGSVHAPRGRPGRASVPGGGSASPTGQRRLRRESDLPGLGAPRRGSGPLARRASPTAPLAAQPTLLGVCTVLRRRLLGHHYAVKPPSEPIHRPRFAPRRGAWGGQPPAPNRVQQLVNCNLRRRFWHHAPAMATNERPNGPNTPASPHEFPRRILLASLGLTPQVLTETLYALLSPRNRKSSPSSPLKFRS